MSLKEKTEANKLLVFIKFKEKRDRKRRQQEGTGNSGRDTKRDSRRRQFSRVNHLENVF